MLKRPSSLRRFHREERGLAAVEFALILPVMLAMLFGMGELSHAVYARTAVSQIAGTVTDLVAQKSTLTSSDFSSVYAAANTLLYPYYPQNSGLPTIRITSVIYDTATNSETVGKVAWSCAQSGNANLKPLVNGDVGGKAKRTTGSTVTLTKKLLSAGASVLITEVAYGYSSPTSQVLIGTKDFTDNFVTKPRRVAAIPAPASCT